MYRKYKKTPTGTSEATSHIEKLGVQPSVGVEDNIVHLPEESKSWEEGRPTLIQSAESESAEGAISDVQPSQDNLTQPSEESKPIAENKKSTEEMAVLEYRLSEAIGEQASLLGAKSNLLPEEEQKLIPIMSKIFRIAAEMGFIQFKESAKFVVKQIRSIAGKNIADKLSIDNLQAGYINIAKEIGGDKREAMNSVYHQTRAQPRS